MKKLSHLDHQGRARMVDTSSKPVSARRAVASALVRMSPETWQEPLDVNLGGTFLFTRAVAALMMRQRSGRIVNITSVAAESGNPGQTNYAAAKAVVEGFTRSLARELAS